MSLSWEDASAWRLENRSLIGFASPYVGNGTLGTRIGVLVLGTDSRAPEWSGCGGVPQHWSDLPPGDPFRPLPTFSSFVRDGYQYALPSWNQLELSIDDVPFTPQHGTHHFCQMLDLRTGEAELADDWEYTPGRRAQVQIRLLIPRTHPHASLWELQVRSSGAAVKAGFGLRARHLKPDLVMQYRREGDTIFGTGSTARQKRLVAQGLLWFTDGELHQSQIEDGEAHIEATARKGQLTLTVFHAVHGGLEGTEGAESRVRADLVDLQQSWEKDLRQRNMALWQTYWRRALRCDDLSTEDFRLVLAQQYYLLASLDETHHPFGPLGVSGNNWYGAALWDADRWIGGAVVGLWPELARRFPAYRVAILPATREFAAQNGYSGAWFPWAHDEAGRNITPPEYLPEIHNNVWAAHTAWELWLETHDSTVLREQAWPLLRAAAEFFASRCVCDSDGSWHLRGVIGPDEAVGEVYHNTCDDNVLVNLAVRWLMQTTYAASGLVGAPADPAWLTIAQKLTVLPPRANGVIPEHAAYVDQGIKQADTIMAFFPLDYPAPPEIVRATVDYYHDKILNYGPLMTTQIEAAIYMRLGDRADGLARLFTCYRDYVRGPFLVPFECRQNDTAVMLTGIGGLLQALMAGWYGWRAGNGTMLPRLGDTW